VCRALTSLELPFSTCSALDEVNLCSIYQHTTNRRFIPILGTVSAIRSHLLEQTVQGSLLRNYLAFWVHSAAIQCKQTIVGRG